MLDVLDFIAERGGNPEKIRESQRRRFANVEIVDEIIALFDDHRKSEPTDSSVRSSHVNNQLTSMFFLRSAQYSATQVNTKINEIQKQIGAKKKVREAGALLALPAARLSHIADHH